MEESEERLQNGNRMYIREIGGKMEKEQDTFRHVKLREKEGDKHIYIYT